MSYPIDWAYHVHTKRCKHAEGTEEEMVIAAIKAGIKFLAFSDHVPHPIVHGGSFVRMDLEELDDYCNTVNMLKEKYKDQIEIHLGLECEYDPMFKDYYKDLLDSKKVEYLILGQHGFMKNGEWTWHAADNDDPSLNWENYFTHCLEGLKSGLFKYFAHPDWVLNSCHGLAKDKCLEYGEILVQEAVKRGIMLEINCQGVLNSHKNIDLYPCLDYWKMVASFKDAKITIGVDCHNYHMFEDPDAVLYCLDIAKQAGITNLHGKEKFWL